MSFPPDEDNPSPSTLAYLAIPSGSYPVRKGAPPPITISSSNRSNPNSPASPSQRNSLESYRSDLNSVRSEITSLHCSEFPAPPSALPPILASPATPKSLYFSTTPTTPLSRPLSGHSARLQDIPRGTGRVLLDSPKSIKGFFSTSRPQSPSIKSGDRQYHSLKPQDDGEIQTKLSSKGEPKLGYDSTRDSVPAHYSQYAVYKESNALPTSQPTTPTTLGTLSPKDWASSSGRTSPLLHPRPAFVKPDASPRSHSPLRYEPAFATQQANHGHTSRDARPKRDVPPNPISSRSASPQPPRSPLPIPPSNRDSFRTSARYSHIARQAGITDMGMDINEEELLSTEFITEMLRQPATSISTSQRLLIPDYPRPETLHSDVGSENTDILSGHMRGNELHFASDDLLSPIIVGVKKDEDVSETSAMGQVSLPSADGVFTIPVENNTPEQRTDQRVQSGLASSVFPSGTDKIFFDSSERSPYLSSPGAQSLAVLSPNFKSHGSPHPFVPSTPMSADSFYGGLSPSPNSPHGFAKAQAKHFPVGLSSRNSSTSQMIASRLPIGGRPVPSRAPFTPNAQKLTSSRVSSSRIRQHRYPRSITQVASPSQKSQTSENFPMQNMTSRSISPSEEISQEDIHEQADGENSAEPRAMRHSLSPSTKSQTSSTRTERDSTTILPSMSDSRHASSDLQTISDELASVFTYSNPRHSYNTKLPSASISSHDGSEFAPSTIEGEVQVANRIWSVADPTIEGAGERKTATVVGVASAVIVNPRAGESSPPTEARHSSQFLEAPIPSSSNPPSPRQPPSIDSPPSHRADIPESAKSFLFSEDTHEGRYLPHSGNAEYRSETFWSAMPSSFNSPIHQRRQSNNATSFKSVVSYLTTKSKASHKSAKSTVSSRWARLLRKPLPPLPPQAFQNDKYDNASMEGEEDGGDHIYASTQHGGSSAPMFDGTDYQRSKVSLPRIGEPQGWNDINVEKTPMNSLPRGKFEMLGEDSLRVAKGRGDNTVQSRSYYDTRGSFDTSRNQKRRGPVDRLASLIKRDTNKWFWLPLIILVVIVIVIVTVVAVILGRKHKTSGSSSCDAGTAGVRCNLNATCTCPSPSSSSCAAPLAKELSDLVPVVSRIFTTNITEEAMALVIWETQGTPVSSTDCSSQATLVDVGTAIDPSASPNRTQWAQAALLWNLFQSGDVDATRTMQTAMQRLHFSSLSSVDGPAVDPTGNFAVVSLGYLFNFAAQTVTPTSLSFKADASPSLQQLSEVNSAMGSALDRMYSFASSSSTQGQAALSTYWQAVLSLHPGDLHAFLEAFKSAPVLLPFDATAAPGGHSINDLLVGAVNKTLSFPPPIGCFPGLSSSQLNRINTIQAQAFGLPTITSSAGAFDSSCFANNPVYGTLDVLRLRTPFDDSRAGAAKQAVVLTTDAAVRATLHVGELLEALPAPNITDISPFDVDPRQFGTLSHLNHIALQWLRAFPSTAMAASAAKFLVTSPTVPPSSGTGLFNSTSIPTIEVAFFGNVFLSDISSFVSSFSTPSGGLFFGSAQGQAFRRWALQQSSQATIAWAQRAFDPQVVHEGSNSTLLFEQIWNGAGTLTNGPTNSDSVQEVVVALNNAGLFSP